jgi:multiple sugar transport system ATP-binding protein
MVGLLIGSQAIVARLAPHVQVAPGRRVKVAPDAARLHLFDADGGANIGLSAS